jgi:hypothetical protein
LAHDVVLAAAPIENIQLDGINEDDWNDDVDMMLDAAEARHEW